MTVLLSKVDRLSQGIDTIERSIVYALLALRQVNADGANKEAVQVTLSANAATDAINATLSGQAKLYYSSPTALTGGFNLLEAITPYGSETPDLFQDFDPSVGLEEGIPEEPATVETLEQFLLWCAMVLSASTHPLSLNYVKFSVFESADPPNLSIAFSLPLDYGRFLLTGNWIESVQKVFDYHITDPDQLISPFTIPPSQQFWGDPVDDLTALSALTGQAVGNTRWVHSEEAFYSLLVELPVGESLDGVIYVDGEGDTVWRKGGVKGDPGDPGSPGADGLSAYQIAVAAGFVGTEQDWLDSLVGPTGADGADGSDGLSAYEVAVANGFVGTEAAWLDSLVGETGPAGADGADGLPGAGIDWRGVWNSATAYVENDGVSYLGSAYIANAANTNKTPGVDPEWDLWVAKGEPGADGADGGGHVIQDDGSVLAQRANLNFKGFKVTDDSGSDSTIIQIADTLTDKAIYWYDAVAKILKPIPIGEDGQALIAKPALNPPYQFATPSGGREVLTANRTYYVRTDGNDSNDGLSNTAGGAFLTPQKFQDALVTLDKNGYSVVCQFANGTYTLTSSVLIKDGVGDGEVTLRGNTATPANVVFTSANNIVYFKKFTNTNLNIEGFKFVNTGANNNTVFLGLYAGLTKFKNLDFGAMTTGSNSAQWNLVLDYTASVVPVGNFTISGNARAHALIAGNGVYRDDFSINPPGTSITVTLTGTPAFIQYIDVFGSAVYAMDSARQTFSGSATGKRYNCGDQGLISIGAGGASYLPGNAAGTLTAGGTYTA